MKTKTRTIIGIVALGIIGFTTINATAGNYGMTSYAAAETEESLTIESWMLENDLFAKRTETKAAHAQKVEKAKKEETEKALEIQAWMTNEDFFKAAESYTASTSDKEIEKYANKQIVLQEKKKSK